MHIHVLTIFPGIFANFLETSLIGKAVKKGLMSVSLRDIRDFAPPPHQHVDDVPYGGGPGMVMKPEPLVAAIEEAKGLYPEARVVLLSASGEKFTQMKAQAFSAQKSIIMICGRYEGVDQRVIDLCVDEEISIGDFVLMGGEVPAMAVIEATCRLLPDVIGKIESTEAESFSTGMDGRILLEWPQYTRPENFRNMTVPEILRSGDHRKIKQWRYKQGLEKTKRVRPDLLKGQGEK